ncbi:MAG: c-type cytochrome domain-containing protein [Bacteroidota bacterium]
MQLSDSPQTGLGELVGRLHPLVVHFPIGIVALALGLEAINWKWPDSISVKGMKIVLGLGVLSSLFAVLAGFFLYRSGEYGGEMVRQHFWGAVFLSILLLATYLANGKASTDSGSLWKSMYIGLLIGANLLLVYTGHLGGTLTHGEGYLSSWMPDLRPPAPIEQKAREDLLVFDDLVLPVFQQNCQSCHNQNKTKGGLLLTSFEEMMEGGKSKKAMLTAFEHEQSELFQRMVSPLSEDGHMPPSNKPQPDSAVLNLLAAWIENGASDSLVLADLCLEDSLHPWLDEVIPQFAEKQRDQLAQRQALLESAPDLQEVCEDLGLLLTLDEDMDSSHFAISMQIPPKQVGDAALLELLPYSHLISKLSLPSAEISDDGLFHISQMTELRELFLQKTCIKGEGLAYLIELPQLTLLNLSVNSVDETGLIYLLGSESLERVYLFDTETSPRTIEAMRHHMPKTEFLEEEGPYF